MENFSSIKPLIDKIATDNGFYHYELSFEVGSDLGFIGVLKRCRIIEEDKELSVFIKFLPRDEEQNSRFNSFSLFEREVIIYSELFPALEKFQLENGLEFNNPDGFWSYPKCYYCNYDIDSPENSIIIMEDLTVNNFEVKDKFIPSDFQHTSKLFIELAKLHGLSLALKLKKPSIFEKFKCLKNSMCLLMTNDSMKNLAPRNCELICKIFRDDKEILDKLNSYKNNLWEKVSEVLEAATSESMAVICHGDAWINNVLYNYKDSEKQVIKDTKLVDWQITFYGSLGAELTYFLYCCVDKSVRDKHQSELFNLYYETMRRIFKRFSLSIEEIFPYSEFERQLRIYGLYAFSMANFAIPLLCKYPEKIFEDENVILTEDEKRCVDDYNSRMKDVILDMIQMKIL